MNTETKLPVMCVIDDENSTARALERLFENLEANVQVFVDPLEAAAWLEDNPVDLLITDQRMPGMCGTELIEQLPDSQAGAVRFILSGYSDSDEITELLERGDIHEYMVKPWHDEELLFAVTQVLAEAVKNAVPDCSRIRPVSELEREAIEGALKRCDDSIVRAADMLKISASMVHRKMQSWAVAS